MCNINWKVCVRCLTYNQSNEIVDALNGFCMQQTDFPYVCCVIDDASTDGEQEKIKSYFYKNFNYDDYIIEQKDNQDYQLLYGRHLINENCFFCVALLKQNLYSQNLSYKKLEYIAKWRNKAEYEALCEGDDYWIDVTKLQRQVDYLDANPDCVMCVHNAFWLTIGPSNKSARLFNSYNDDKDISLETVINQWVIPTASMVIRKGYWDIPEWMPKVYCADFARTLSCINEGTIHYINSISSVYRYNKQDTSGSMSSRYNGLAILKEHHKLLVGFRQHAKEKYIKSLDQRIQELEDSIFYHASLSSKKYWNLLISPSVIVRMVFAKYFKRSSK